MTTINSSWARYIKTNLGYITQTYTKIPRPELLAGVDSLLDLPSLLKKINVSSVMIVTDNFLATTEMFGNCTKNLRDNGIKVEVFPEIEPDPPAATAVKGAKIYLEKGCGALIGFGGGSSIDCMKLMNLIIDDVKRCKVDKANLDKVGYAKKFMGIGGVSPKFKPEIMIAIPTTAGTGSETTSAAVISFPEVKKKYYAVDVLLVPQYAVLDPKLLETLPKGMTAATGVDALTHAVESFLGQWSIQETKEFSGRAVEKIFRNLVECYNNPANLKAREQMLLASYEAGVAFTRANVGYVHAIAHQLGGLFHTPHGIGNAMVLPKLLDFYFASENELVMERLAYLYTKIPEYESLSDEVKNQLSNKVMAGKFIAAVKSLNDELGIPKVVKGFSLDLVETVALRAIKEAHGCAFEFRDMGFLQTLLDIGYPVPVYMTVEQCQGILASLVDFSAPLGSNL
eukprot:maker-scaffold_19-snap-gene-6.5-mRNA-1 protein AED:0.01 eAED:0.01 QI:213/1/1/1/1/1/2/38/454